MALPPRGTRPQGHHRDRSQPQAEAQVQDPRRHPSLGLGPQAAQRPHRGVGVASSQRSPRPRVPVPAARSRNRFKHRRGPPTRTHVSGKRGKRSRIAGVRGSHTRVPGWAQETPMGSSQEGQLLCSPSQPGRDADLLDDTDVARPRATIPERPLLEGEKAATRRQAGALLLHRRQQRGLHNRLLLQEQGLAAHPGQPARGLHAEVV
ncbi:protein polyglycylase TTLL10-like [Ursus americanus]|uniref:protein polyglycylase TTLL10-like n=1 Tax=Ursus americanus TaxID=9643 RepID=UPI001E67CAA0|nr:protein polyglycylase TTLL10-like [Ursus americanus]